MPVVRDIRVRLRSRNILRREGIREHSHLRPEVKDVIKELLAETRRAGLLQPALAYEIYAIAHMGTDSVCLDGGAELQAPLLPAAVPEAEELAVAACTIGPQLESKVSEYSQAGEALRALLLDGIGTAAVDSLVAETCQIVEQQAATHGLQSSSPLFPGMTGFNLTEQRKMIDLVSADEIGITVTESATLVPRKSVSMVLGIGTHMTRWTQAQVCARCSLRETCPYRVQEQPEKHTTVESRMR